MRGLLKASVLNLLLVSVLFSTAIVRADENSDLSISNQSLNSFGNSASEMYPQNPNTDKTPGELCDTPNAYRYPEKIKYCERNVTPELKREIIAEYDSDLGYRITQMDRSKFKIDHLIPLCVGGANTKKNLWPQHESVYRITDRLEAELCTKMADGKLMQRRAVELILTAKRNLEKADQIFKDVEAL
jgi:hypothetical protein